MISFLSPWLCQRAMLSTRSPKARLQLLSAAAVTTFFVTYLVGAAGTPPEATAYVSHDDTVTYFVTARPSKLGDRCYQETTGTALCSTGQRCIETGRDASYHVIEMAAVHTQLCTSVCCPAKPPVGTCYKKWLTYSCAAGYTIAYSSLVHSGGSLCCTPGSCFWFQTSLTNCKCPTGYSAVDRTDSCTAWGWALCCPEKTDLTAMQLSDRPFESSMPPSPAAAAPPTAASAAN